MQKKERGKNNMCDWFDAGFRYILKIPCKSQPYYPS